MRALFIGAAVTPPPANLTTQQRFGYLGSNTGNLLIGQSLREELELTEYAYGMRTPPNEVDERFDVIIIPAANFIFRNFDFGYLADYLEKTRLPIVMAGIGAQAPSGTSKVADIPLGTIRFLNIVSERSKSIGVRGYFTADVLDGLGIKNAVPVGCPSFYRSLKPTTSIVHPENLSHLRVSLNGSRNVYEHAGTPEAARRLEAEVLAYAVKTGSPYVLQNESPELGVCCGDPLDDTVLAGLRSVAKRMSLDLEPRAFARLIQKQFHVFFSIEEWQRYIIRFDLSIGSRFHGNIMALTSGVPAIVLTHDSRTTELCEFAAVPHFAVEQIDVFNPVALYELADFSLFEARYVELYQAFHTFLVGNGLPSKLVAGPEVPA